MDAISFSRVILLTLIAVMNAPRCHAITPIEPFVGKYTEGFESFRAGEILGSAENTAGPVEILDGHGSLTGINPIYPINPFYIYYDEFSIDDLTPQEGHVSAVPFDGTRGLALQSVLLVDPIAKIDFDQPISAFGAYWVHAVTRETIGPIVVTLFGPAGRTIGTARITYDYSGLRGEHQWFGWSSEVPIHSVTYTGPWAGIDGIQINVVPEPTFAGPACFAGAYLACVLRLRTRRERAA